MLKDVPREAQAYADILHGRTLVLKASGAEINGPDFSVLAEDVRDLVSRGVKIVLVFGGGDQINEHYGKFSAEPRTKIDGVGVTDENVLRHGVLPAFRDIRGKIAKALPEATILETDDLVCDYTEDRRYGFVGVPKELILPDTNLSVVGFAGKVGNEEVNVNADDVAMQLARQCKDEIEELILLTGTGGVLDNKGKVVSLLSDAKLDEIIEGRSKSVSVNGGMLKKIKEVRRALDLVGKVVITKTSALERELLQWMGDGTLCIDGKQMKAGSMRYTEGPIFDAVYAEHVRTGVFRPRSAHEVERLKMNHKVVRIKNSPLGGFSPVPNGDWLELGAVWAGTIGNGVGRMVMDASLEHAGKRKMFALSADEDAVAAFQRHPGFDALGPLSDVKGSERIPTHLSAYDTTNRNPHVFIAKRKS